MILQLVRLGFFHCHHHRHHNHHHHRRHPLEVNLSSLQAFRSLVSENLNRALESLKNGPELLSLTWIHHCFQMVAMINNAFTNLMVEIDYPVSSWEVNSVNEYLDYTINLLDLLNYISSSIAHVNQARVSLTHALSLMESSPALAIERVREMNEHDDTTKEFKANGGDHVNKNLNETEWIFHEAMMVLRSTGFWVCGVVLSGLKGRVDPIMDITRNKLVTMDSSLKALDSIFREKFMENDGIMKEVEAVNESVRLIISNGTDDFDGGMELKRRLKVVGNGLTGLKEQEECLFGAVMATRNEVLEILRRNKNK